MLEVTSFTDLVHHTGGYRSRHVLRSKLLNIADYLRLPQTSLHIEFVSELFSTLPNVYVLM